MKLIAYQGRLLAINSFSAEETPRPTNDKTRQSSNICFKSSLGITLISLNDSTLIVHSFLHFYFQRRKQPAYICLQTRQNIGQRLQWLFISDYLIPKLTS